MNEELADLTISELKLYRQRKMDRAIDHARNMEWYLDREDWDNAEFHRKRSDDIMAEVNVIGHCIRIVAKNVHRNSN